VEDRPGRRDIVVCRATRSHGMLEKE
jgi:hypothetical protein